jgi:hypothetical protein
MTTRSPAQLDHDLGVVETNYKNKVNPAMTSIEGLGQRLGSLEGKYKTDIADIKTRLTSLEASTKATRLLLVGVVMTGQFIKIDPSIIKIDEKGISIVGATRPWPWAKKVEQLEKRWKALFNKKEKDKQQAEANLKKELQNLPATVRKHTGQLTKIQAALSKAGASSGKQSKIGSPAARAAFRDVQSLRTALGALARELG